VTKQTKAKQPKRPKKFTDAFLAGLKPTGDARAVTLFEAGGSGLGVRASRSGKIAFIAQLAIPDDKRRWRETIGTWGGMTIADARALVGKMALDMRLGVDLHKQRAEAEAAKADDAEERKFTLKDLVEAWRSKHLIVNRRPSYAKRAPRAIELTFESLLKRPATAITADEARKARIAAEDKRGVAAARFATAALIAACHWAVKQGRLKASPIDGLSLPSAQPGRDRVLSVAEIRRVWGAACRLPYPAGPFVRLLLLTGARRSEIAGLKRAEIVEGDTGLKTIELGPERTKTGARHVIPLAEAALDVLAACPRFSGCEYVFSSDGWRAINNFDRLKLALDAEIAADGSPPPLKEMPYWVFHDLRHTIVTHLSGEAFNGGEGFDPIVLDKLLGHQPAQLRGMAKRYNHQEFLPARRRALTAWADFVAREPAPVVEIAPLIKGRIKRA
jgi:integrase